MKKGLIAVAVLVAGGVAAMPYVTGKIAESETRNMLGIMSEKPEQYGRMAIKQYDRGYRSSKVSYDYELPASLALMAGGEKTYVVDCDYVHGLLGITYDCDFLGNPEYKAFIEKEFDGKDPVSLTGAVTMGGGWSQNLAIEAIDAETDTGTFKLEPSTMSVQTNKEFSVYEGEVKLGKFDIASVEGTLKMNPSNLVFNLKPTEIGLYEGKYTMDVGDLELLAEGNTMTMSGLTLDAEGVERGEVMDAMVDLSLADFSGGGASAKNVKLKYDVLGLNSQALLDYQEFANQMQADMLASLEEGDVEAATANQMMALLPIVERMLDKGLKLNVKASGDIMEKPNSMQIDMELLKKTSFTELSALAFNPESVLSHFNVSMAASLNQGLVQSNPQLGAMIANSPFFKSVDGNYETALKVGEESAVNGQKVSFQQLMGMAMAAAQPPAQPQPTPEGVTE